MRAVTKTVPDSEGEFLILTISSITLCLCLLSFTVIALRHNQVKAGLVIAERCVPLGPNDHDSDLCQLKLASGTSGEVVHYQGLQISGLEEQCLSWTDNQLPVAAVPLTENSEEKAQYPMLGAFNQRAIHLRKALKSPALTISERKSTLLSLYQNAAVTEILHGKNTQGRLPLARLKALPKQFIDELDMPYQAIGYRSLTLLCKSDQKQIRAAWGEPEAHQCPREYHRQRWNTLISHFG